MKFLIYALISLPVFFVFARDRKFDQLYQRVNLQKFPIASSHLIEKGRSRKEYSGESIKDNHYHTAWCVTKNMGIGEFVYLPFPNDGYFTSYDNLIGKQFPISLVFFNGFSKTEDLFYANNRVKKVRIELFEIAYSYATGDFTLEGDISLNGEPILNSSHEIYLVDTIDRQEVNIKLQAKLKNKEYYNMGILAKMTILEIYPGLKYKDTCITEAGLYLDVEELKKR